MDVGVSGQAGRGPVEGGGEGQFSGSCENGRVVHAKLAIGRGRPEMKLEFSQRWLWSRETMVVRHAAAPLCRAALLQRKP